MSVREVGTPEEEFLQHVAVAKQEVCEAEHIVWQIVRSLDVVPRSEKTTITAVVTSALSHLEKAKQTLSQLEALARAGKL